MVTYCAILWEDYFRIGCSSELISVNPIPLRTCGYTLLGKLDVREVAARSCNPGTRGEDVHHDQREQKNKRLVNVRGTLGPLAWSRIFRGHKYRSDGDGATCLSLFDGILSCFNYRHKINGVKSRAGVRLMISCQ